MRHEIQSLSRPPLEYLDNDPQAQEGLKDVVVFYDIPRLVVVEENQASIVFKVEFEDAEAGFWSQLERADEESKWLVVGCGLQEFIPKHQYSFSDSIISFSISK